MVNTETKRVQHIYDNVADRYDALIGLSERVFFGNGRAWVCEQARGQTLEIAVGTGRNFPYYPSTVSLTGIDISSAMLHIAQARAATLRRDVTLGVGDAQALAFPDSSFDTVVFTLALCSIPDERQALLEAKRVLRPAGQLLLLEHVRSPAPVVQAAQRVLNPLFVRVQGDHLLREPLDVITLEGFVVTRVERSALGIVERLAALKQA